MKHIGMNLLKAREYLGLSQKQVAQILGEDIADIKAYESGSKCPDSRTLIRFSNLYGVTCLELLTEHDFSLTKDERAVTELLKMKDEIYKQS